MHARTAFFSSLPLIAGLAVASPAHADIFGALIGRSAPKPVLRPDKAGEIANIMRQGLIPADVISASLSALANGLAQGQSVSATLDGVAYAWSIQSGPLAASGCRIVAGGWKRPEEAKPGFTADGAWCWDSNGWYPKQVRIGGELSAARAPQAPVRSKPSSGPVVADARQRRNQPVPSPTPPVPATIENVNSAQMVVMESPLKAAPDMASATLATLPLGARVRATGIVHGPVSFVRVVTAAGQTGYMLGGRIAPAPTNPAPVQAQAPTVVATAPAPLQPAPEETPPERAPAAPVAVVQAPPPPPAPAPVVVQAPPPPAPVQAQAPAIVPAAPAKPKVKSDL